MLMHTKYYAIYSKVENDLYNKVFKNNMSPAPCWCKLNIIIYNKVENDLYNKVFIICHQRHIGVNWILYYL